MVGVIPLTNIMYLAGHGSKNALSCGSSACVRSGMSSSSSTQLHGFRNRNSKVPYHQLHHNEAFGAPIEKWHKVENSKTTERLIVRSDVIEEAKTEQKQEVSTSTTTTSSTATGDDTVGETNGSPEGKGAKEKQHPYSHLQVGKRWRKIQGENRWEGLLEPLDDVLRGELIRYGEFTQATYDSFDYDTHSRFCGSNKYSKGRFFQKMGLQNCGYEVTDYIYATAGEGLPLAKYFTYMDVVDEKGNAQKKQDAWDLESNWMGYVAVTTDPNEIKRLGRRDIVVVWRGTITKLEWLEDLRDYTGPTGLDPRQVGQSGAVDLKVESGFLQLYKSADPRSPYTRKSARRQLLEAITRLVRKYADEELSITVTGHSLGSALAMLAGYDIAESGVNQASKLPEQIAHWDEPDEGRDPNQVVEWTRSEDVKTVPVTVYSFGGPRVGNDAFRDRIEETGVKMLRVVNSNDIVPEVPGMMFNERIDFLEKPLAWFWRWLESLPWTFSQVGVPLYIDHMVSPFLKKTRNPNTAHNLEGYMHVLSGFHGERKPFAQVISRDIALVNKSSDFVEKPYVPASWWQEANKGLVKTEDGRWIPRPREKVDYPDYDLDEQT